MISGILHVPKVGRRWCDGKGDRTSADHRLLGRQQQVRAIRVRLAHHSRLRDQALFNFANDSKLRVCDVVKVRTDDVVSSGRVRNCPVAVHQKTERSVRFELLDSA